MLDFYCVVNYFVYMKCNIERMRLLDDEYMGYAMILADLADRLTSLVLLNNSPMTLMDLYAYFNVEPKKFHEIIEYLVNNSVIGIFLGKNKELIFVNPDFYNTNLSVPVNFAMFSKECSNGIYIKPEYKKNHFKDAINSRLKFLEMK